MNIKKLPNGFVVPADDTHISRWQQGVGRLDHDTFLIPLGCSFIKPGSCVIDCGAFNGDHTIAFSRTVKDGVVIAVEPGDVAYACLEQNAQLFPEKNVKTLKMAVGIRGAVGKHSCLPNLGSSYVGLSGEGADIAICSLDEIYYSFGQSKPLSFIKMDIEGMELQALMGAEDILHRHRPVWLIEINLGALERNYATPKQVWELMKAHSYRVRIAEPQCTIDSPQYDIICEPSSP